MKHFPTLLLGLLAVSSVACQAHQHALAPQDEVVVIDLTGLR
jgi:hypothetical protein